METKVDLERNKVFHLENTMVMHGIYNAEMIEKIVNTLEKLHNKTTWNERLFSGKLVHWFN